MSDKASERTIPAVNASGALDGDALADHISAVVEQGAAAFLAGRRWFGDKARRIERAETFDVAVVSAGPDYFAPTLVTVGFADGGSAAYFLPLVITLESLPEDATLGTVVHGEDHWRLVEGLSVPRFQEWLLSRLEAPATLPMQAGTLQFEPTSVLSRYLAAAQTGGSRAITGEQSNTSIIYGDAAILKAFRKIQPGVNPDIEIGAYLTEETEFRHVPPVLGSMHYLREGAEPVSIGVLQTFVPSTGDAWTMTLKELTDLIQGHHESSAQTEAFAKAVHWASLLGQRTGELHVALAAAEGHDAFRPEPVTADDIAGWKAALGEAADHRRADLEASGSTLVNQAVTDRARARLSAKSIETVGAGFAALNGTARIRVHGDYHLGQVLRTIDGDVMILDFEGEPSRPISERRLKTSCLKDVAGMLRSFSYARVAVAMSLAGEHAGPAEDLLRVWEAAARDGFLTSYRDATRDAAVRLAPAGAAPFHQALRAWEIDKALYEIHYELNNRPHWLGHVLETLSAPGSGDDSPVY